MFPRVSLLLRQSESQSLAGQVAVVDRSAGNVYNHRMRKYILSLGFLLGFLCAGNPAQKQSSDFNVRDVTVELRSGVKIIGTMMRPRIKNNYTFVLLHGLGSDRNEWRGCAKTLHALGYGVFLYDARGHGQSIKDGGGNTISYKTFSPFDRNSQWQLMVDDLDEILQYLKDFEAVNGNRFVLCGASLGANVALTCASRRKDIQGLILLSPGMDYAGIAAEYPMRFCPSIPLAIAASKGDSYAFQSAERLASFKPDNKQIVSYWLDGREHGVNMFKQGLGAQLFPWITGTFK
jgi:pimeloyl-ACP methyl ester carboxylesterase